MSMKDPSKLSKKALENIVGNIQAILYGEADETGWTYDPSKEWDVDFLEHIDRLMVDNGLRPKKRFRIRSR
jgi:hypothetical protein